MKNPANLRYPAAARPEVDFYTAIVVDRAVVNLADHRFMTMLDSLVQLHLLASIVAQADQWINEQVQYARESGATWAEIGRLLGINATVARQRYAPTRATR